jgi:hypothetical protein
VREFYEQELERERQTTARTTGILHNQQFLGGFAQIKEMYLDLRASDGPISARVAHAYQKMMTHEANLGLGPGLAADFAAIAIYLEITYGGNAEKIF